MANANDIRRPRTEERSFSSGIAWIIPRAGGAYFAIHRELIQARTPYFSRVLGPYKTNLQMLSQEDATVNAYIHWLYTGLICSKEPVTPTNKRKQGSETEEEDKEYITLAKLFRFGKTVQDAEFQDVIIDAFISKLREPRSIKGGWKLPGPQCINIMHRPDYSALHPLTRLILETYAREGQPDDIVRLKDIVSPQFLLALSSKIAELRTKPAKRMGQIEASQFHSQSDAVEGDSNGNPSKRRRIE